MKTYNSALSKLRVSVLSAILLPFYATAATDVAQMLYRYTFETLSDGAPVNEGGLGLLTATTNGIPIYATDTAKFGATSFNNTTGNILLANDSGIDSLNDTTGYTLSWWANIRGGTGRSQHFGFQQGTVNYGAGGGVGNALNLWVRYTTNGDWLRFGNTISGGVWTHFAIVIENGRITGYVDGRLNSDPNYASHINMLLAANSNGPLKRICIGTGEGAVNAKYSNTGIDEVAVFDRALSADAITWLRNNPAESAIPFLRPRITVGAATTFSTAVWAWPEGSSSDPAAPGDLAVMGSGARMITMDVYSTVTGNLTVLQSEGRITDDASLTIATSGGKLTVQGSTTLRNTTTIEAGAATLANVTLDSGKTLTVNDATSLSGNIEIQAGSMLDLSNAVFPLVGVTSLTIDSGAVLRIPGLPESGLKVLESDEFSFTVNGTLQDAEGEPITPYTVTGAWIIPPITGPLIWDSATGTWSRTIWKNGAERTTNDRETTFNDVEGSETATVNVSGTVLPATIIFDNSATAYTFATGDDGTIALPTGVPLATKDSGAPVVFNVPFTLTGALTASDASSLTLNRVAGTYTGAFETGTGSMLKLGLAADATLSGPLSLGADSTLEINTAANQTANLNTGFTGSGNIHVTGEGLVSFNSTSGFSGQVQVSESATFKCTANGTQYGVFSNAQFTPLKVIGNATLEFSNNNPAGYNTGNYAATFVELHDSATLRTISGSTLWSRGMTFNGANISVITSTLFNFFLGITLKNEAGTTTFSKTSTTQNYGLNNATPAANVNKVIFDVGEEAQTLFNAPLIGSTTPDVGIRKTGPGTLTFTAGILTFTNGELNDTAVSELNAGITELTSTATANGNWIINSGATLKGTGRQTGSGVITVNEGGMIETGLTVNNLAFASGGIVSIAADTPTLTVSGSMAVPQDVTAIIDAGAINPGSNYGKLLDVITWPDGAAPEGTFTLGAGQSKTFTLKTEPTGLALYRVSGILISLY